MRRISGDKLSISPDSRNYNSTDSYVYVEHPRSPRGVVAMDREMRGVCPHNNPCFSFWEQYLDMGSDIPGLDSSDRIGGDNN